MTLFTHSFQIGDSSIINRALYELDRQMKSGRRVKNVVGLLCSKLHHYERLAKADPGPTAEPSASHLASPSEMPSDVPSSSPSAKSSVNSSIDAEGGTTAPLINAAHGNAISAESLEGTSDSSFKWERMGSASSSAEQTVLMPVNDGSTASKTASSDTHKLLPTQSKASAVTVTSDYVAKAGKILEYLARDGRDVARDGKYIDVLFASDPDAIMTALTILLKASGGDENKINALLSAVRLFLRTAVKKSDERAKLHIDAFEASEDVRNCMESICRDNPSLAPSFQSFGDKLKGVKGVSAVFIDATFKPVFTKVLQKEEERRTIELRRAEEVERQRLEAERQAAETERQRLEAQRREQEASKSRQMLADQQKELEENARPLTETAGAENGKGAPNVNSGLGANLQQHGLLRGLLKASSAPNGSRGTGTSISNKQKQITANTLQQQMAKNVAARLQLERKQNAEKAKVEAEKNIASVISSLESMVEIDDDKLAERSKSSLGDLKDLTASGQINAAVLLQDGAKLIDVFKSVYTRLKKINKQHPVFREATELKQNWMDVLDIATLEENSAKLDGLCKSGEPTKLEEELPAILDCLENITDKSAGAVSPARLRSMALIDHLDKIQQKLSSLQSNNLVGRVAKLREKWSAGSSGLKRSSIPKRRKPSGAKSDVNESKKKKKKAEKQAPKKRKKNKNNSYEQELRAEAKYLNEDNGERSRRAGFGSIAPVQDPQNVTDEPDLTVPDAHRQSVGEEKGKLIDIIIDYVREHPDFLNDKGRGKSIYLGNNLFLSLSLLGGDTLRNLVGLIEKKFSTMDVQEKLNEAMKSCEFYYDTKTQNFYNSSGEIICTMDEENDDNNEEILDILSRAGAYYVFAFNKNGELYAHSGGKYMSLARFFDYAYINTSQINRLLDENGKPPARIVFCSMAQLPFAGDLDMNDEVPNTRNRIVEVVESVLLKILKPTIPGRQLYGDGRTMSAKEFVAQMMRRHGSGQGLGFFHGTKKKKPKSKSKSTGGTGMGAPGMAKASQKTGATACFRDLVDPKKLANFEFHYVKGRGSEQEILGPIQGPLWWNGGLLRTILNGDDAIEFDGKRNQACPFVATHLPIKYLPSDGSEPVELGTVLGGGFEGLFPKPTTWVRLSGITAEINRSDVRDVLKDALQDDEDESIVRVERSAATRTSYGSFDIQFAKVWEARGCVSILNGDKRLFGSKIAVELLYER